MGERGDVVTEARGERDYSCLRNRVLSIALAASDVCLFLGGETITACTLVSHSVMVQEYGICTAVLSTRLVSVIDPLSHVLRAKLTVGMPPLGKYERQVDPARLFAHIVRVTPSVTS